MKRKTKLVVIIILILVVLGFLYSKFLLHTGIFTGQAMLSWNASDDATVQGYKIYYGTNSRNNNCPPGGYSKNIDIGKKTKYTLGNLESEKTYYFSVTSYNEAKKESCFSEEMKKTVSVTLFDKLKGILGM